MSKLELLLLGHFECLLPSGKPATLSMRKTEVLLAFLALTPGIRHPRERLINLLWSNRGEEQARNSLRQCLSTIRKSLGEAAELALEVDRNTVRLNSELIEVDALEFERLAADTELESLMNAAELYRGEFLAGISIRDAASQEWMETERARFKRQYIDILSDLGHIQLASGDFTHAIRSAENLVAQDSLSESGWRLLMRACHENGDRSHALQAFKRCQQVLHSELDVEPEAETLALRDAIASGQAKAAAPVPATAAATTTDTPVPATPAMGDHSIAVLPFDNLSGDPEQEYFSDGITDSITLNLAMFPGLQVKSRNSSFAFKQQLKSVGEISDELKVDYIVEGSIRRSQDRIRITVQLIDTAGGNQIWGKRYDADLSDLFQLEEELSRSIAATVTGQIESDLQRIAIAKGAAGEQSYDLLLSGIYHSQRFNRRDNLIAIDKLNQCLAQDPDNVRAHVYLDTCHTMDYLGRWTVDYQASFELAKSHIERALQLAPELGLVQTFYAEYLIFSGKPDAASRHLDKALEINHNDTDALSIRAICLAVHGDFAGSLQIAEQVCRMDPYHPWAEWELAGGQYHSGAYQATLETIARFRTEPGFTHIFAIASHVKLGHLDTARQALQDFLQTCREDMLSMPQSFDDWLLYIRATYPYEDIQYSQDLIDCLVQAGLEEEPGPRTASSEPNKHPAILVLPFSNLSGDTEQAYFSNGITESIILALSSSWGLKVKSRHTSFAYQDSTQSIREIGDELDVPYIVEGSIRKHQDQVRITVQLVESSTGNQIWGKRYDRPLDELFELEEDLVRNIAGAISGRIGREVRIIASKKPASDMKSFDYLMRGWYYYEQHNPEALAKSIECHKKCIEIDPGNVDAHAFVAGVSASLLYENWCEDREQTKSEIEHYVQKALALDQNNAFTHAIMSDCVNFSRDYEKALYHADRAIELDPTLPDGYIAKATNLVATGDSDKAVELADFGMQLDQFHNYTGWGAGEVYRCAGDYKKAIQAFSTMPNMPPSLHAQTAVCLLGLGQLDKAKAEMAEYLRKAREFMPRVPASQDAWRSLWSENLNYQSGKEFDVFFEQLLQAGLCDEHKEPPDTSPSIAVLPFENMSGDPEQEYFSDGITTDIITTLSRFDHMRTVSRYSVLQYKNQHASVADIAQQQNVRYILEGSVRKSSNSIRVSAELIDSQDGKICWSERYDRDLDDLFAVQDEITQKITLAMKVQLDDGEMARHRSAGTGNIKAWELVMTSIDLTDTYIRQNILEARAMAKQALALDPEYAMAHVMLAWTFWQEVYSGWSKDQERSLAEAEQHSRQALQLDPDNADALAQAGTGFIMRHDVERALDYSGRAVKLEPGNAENQALLAFAHVFAGNYDQARVHEQNTRRLCPIMPNWYYLILGQIEQLSGDLDKAIAIYRRALAVEVDSPLCRFYLVHALTRKGDLAAAQTLANEIRELDSSVNGSGLVRAYSQDAELRNQFHRHLQQFDLV